MRKTSDMLEMEAKYGKPIEQLITETVNANDGSVTAAAKALDDMNVKTLWGWIVRLRIQIKRIAIVA